MNEYFPTDDQSPLPVTVQPRGFQYLLGTWSGRLLLFNTAVFLYIWIRSGSLFLPDSETLLSLGAKDPVKLAQGEIWRLLLPIFIHIGIIHFAFNSYFLYVVGYQLERLLGGPWFMAIYLASGIAGNLASAVFSVNMSAGASSSLFGLLGAGLFLERSIGTRIKKVTGRRPRNRAYAMTVLINLAFGFLMPFIDNSAHVGGLIAGCLLTFAMINLRTNNLQAKRASIGIGAIAVLIVSTAGGIYLATAPKFILPRLVAAGDKTDDPEERIYHYTQALTIDPEDAGVRLKRAREFFAEGEDNYAFHDIRAVIAKGEADATLSQLADELDAKGHQSEAWQLRRMLVHGGKGL